MSSSVPMVRMGPRESKAYLLGLRVPQVLLLVAAGWMVIQVFTTEMPFRLFWVVGVVATLAIGFVPIAGRTIDQYLPVVYNVALQRLTGNDVYRGGVFRSVEDGPLRLPGTLAHLEVLTFDVVGGQQIGIIKDPIAGRYTAVLSVEGTTFPLDSSAEQVAHLGGFERLLASICTPTSSVCRLQILERTEPDGGQSLQRDYNRRGRQDGGFVDASYRQVLASVTAVQQNHEAYVAVSIDARKAAADIRQAGKGAEGAAAVTFREVAAIAEALRSCGVTVHGWLPPRHLGLVIRTAYDPASRDVLEFRGGDINDDRGGDKGLGSGVALGAAGPMRAENHWTYYRTDSAYHRVWWAAEMPRREVQAGFLWPLLLSTSCRRAVSMVFEPVTAKKAAQRINTKASAQAGDESLRAKLRRRTTRREQVEAVDVQRREDEVVAGHAMPRVIMYISTSADSLDELERQSKEIERVAQQSAIEIVRLQGEHDQAFGAAALPLAQGLQ